MSKMLLQAIFFLPTLFTYGILVLLIVILSFVVVYISHKIYISIYDNLPLGHSLSNLPSQQTSMPIVPSRRSEQFVNQASLRSVWITNRSQIFRSSAVRIITSAESCYLAYIEIELPTPKKGRKGVPTASCSCENVHRPTRIKFVKYYDQLSKIPKGKALRSSRRSAETNTNGNMRSVINAVINTAMSRHNINN